MWFWKFCWAITPLILAAIFIIGCIEWQQPTFDTEKNVTYPPYVSTHSKIVSTGTHSATFEYSLSAHILQMLLASKIDSHMALARRREFCDTDVIVIM